MQHLFGKSVHTAFVVPNLEQAMQRMFESGFGPAFMLRQLAISGRFRGHRHDMVMDVAFFAVGGTHYEFIQQIDDSASAYQEFLTLNPHGGMHHIAYYSDDFAADIARAKQAGVVLEVVEELLSPDDNIFELYLQPAGSRDAILTQFMFPGPNETVFAKMEEIAAGWDGEEAECSLYELMPTEITLTVASGSARNLLGVTDA